MAKLVHQHYKDNPKQFIERILDMRLDETTGIEISGEGKPFIKTNPSDRNSWWGTTLAFMSFGYELELTPLQVLSLYNAVANDGKMMKPYLVSAVTEYGREVETFDPEVLVKKICSKETIEKAKIMLEGVVETGTAKSLKSPNYTFAGKTGTAKLTDENGGYKKSYRASFAGYFPADNPQYSCIVLVSEPSGEDYYGGAVAGPVFREIADKVYATNLEIHEPVNSGESKKSLPTAQKGKAGDLKIIFDELGIDADLDDYEGWVSTQVVDSTLQVSEIQFDENTTMPDVRGMGLRDALFVLENKGLKVRASGKGKVKMQSVEAGAAIRRGDVVVIELGI